MPHRHYAGHATNLCDPGSDATISDARDGLTRRERVVLYVLHEIQKERGERNVPTAMYDSSM